MGFLNISTFDITFIESTFNEKGLFMEKFDVIVLGGGPGGYIAAIRASQLGKKVAIVEKEHLGGVCLNKGCIPTKALLKSAHSVHELKSMAKLGINAELVSLDSKIAVKRANEISSKIAKGVSFLMKKNNVAVFDGFGSFKNSNEMNVKLNSRESVDLVAQNYIIATGASYNSFPGLVHDGDRLIGAWEALKMEELPLSIGIVGAGAIGVEFAYFWNAFGVDVHIFELQNHLLPIEDEDSSVEVERAYKKLKIKLSLGVSSVKAENKGDCALITTTEKGEAKEYKFDKVLIAVGMKGNITGFGLEGIGVETHKNFIKVNEFNQTSMGHIYAIGDVSGPPLLAHAASHEGIVASEHLSGHPTHPINKENIPGCTYCYPQVASIGFTERKVKELELEHTIGKVPFRSNGKAIASEEADGFVKVILGKEGNLLGAHIVGAVATELIHEYSLFKTMEGVDEDIFATIHPHPTLGETLAEAVMAAKNRSLNF